MRCFSNLFRTLLTDARRFGMQTISIGPLEFHTAKNITEKLSELNVNHEVIRVGDQLLGDQVETLISNPQRTMLSIELGKTDFESHQQFFRSYGIEILPESSGRARANPVQVL